MLKGLYTAYTGLLNEQHRMDTLTNNLANASTVGFKKEGATSQAFDSVLAYKIKDTSESPNLPKKEGTITYGVKIGENYTDHSEGPMKVTDNTLDCAITGSGFFAIEFTSKDGVTSTKYTRDGSFTLNNQGELTTKDGDFVLDVNGNHIKVNPSSDLQIRSDGVILQNNEEMQQIGLTDFEDYDYLEHYGENLFQTVDGAQTTTTDAKIRSGYLEQANFSVVTEMVNMINVYRAFEANQKVVTTYDNSMQIAANNLGKLI